MDIFHQSLAISILLVLSSYLSLASISEPPTSEWAESPSNADGPTSDNLLRNRLNSVEQCVDNLNKGPNDCVNAVYQIVSDPDGPVPEDKCCINIVEMERVEPICWDMFFPDEKSGRPVVNDLVEYCSNVVQYSGPASAPQPGKSSA